MFYCEGSNCSKKDTCLYHCGVPYGNSVQYRDVSNEGWGRSTGERFETGFYCGDHGDYQQYRSMNIYKDMWEKLKQEINNTRDFHNRYDIRNTIGTLSCDDICDTCEKISQTMTKIESENL